MNIDLSWVAIGGLVGIIIRAYTDGRLVGPNRGKVLEEATDLATRRSVDSLQVALDRFEKYNDRLRSDVSELEDKLEELLARLHAVEEERDYLRSRVDHMVRRFAQIGAQPPPAMDSTEPS